MRVLLVFVLASGVYCQFELCNTNDGRAGVCKSFRSCKQAEDDYFKRGIQVTFCNNGWICCPASSQNVETTARTTTTKNSNRKRISEQKCEEYAKATTVKEEFVQSLLLDSSNGQSISSYTCKYQATGLITGGTVTGIGEFPHMAVIGWYVKETREYDFTCGGSLISNNFVISAAHCYGKARHKKYPDIVRLGDHNLTSYNDGVKEINVAIQQFIVHENYDPSSKRNDIALIKLSRFISFSDTIRPACLWARFDFPKSNAIITGYGSTGFGTYKTDVLMKTQVELHKNKKCSDDFLAGGQYYRLDSAQICAGGKKNDSCQGDSGGPLQIQHGENVCIYYLIGITSFGNRICGVSPGVYTRISSYIDWIERKVWG